MGDQAGGFCVADAAHGADAGIGPFGFALPQRLVQGVVRKACGDADHGIAFALDVGVAPGVFERELRVRIADHCM